MNEDFRIPGRLLGIDHGIKRIGLAVSDASAIVAHEVAIIRRKSKVEDFAQISAHVQRLGVIALVVGCPVDSERAEQGLYSQADKVRSWVEHLRAAVLLPVILWDETLTSVDAAELARNLRRKPTDPIDDLAARLMLQSYLDSVRDGLTEFPG